MHLHGARYLNGGDTLVQSRKKKIILFAGQSNCTGQDTYKNITNANGYVNGYTPVNLTDWVAQGSADPIVWQAAGTTAVAAPYGAAAATVNFGPELALARHLHLVWPNDWHIVKMGVNSSSMALNWLPSSTYPTSPPAGPNLFTQLMNAAAAAATAQNGVISALVWVQGEQDALDATNSANYQANLTTFLNAVRAVYPNLPIVLARIPASSPVTYNTAVYNAQTTVAASIGNCTLVNTDDLVPLITSYHFSANNLVTFGHRLGTAVLGILGIPDAHQVVGWTTDGDGIAFPQNAAEWNALLAAAGISSGGPFRVTDCTVASGNLPDLLGTGVSLVASGTAATYQATVPGFTRTGVQAADAATTKFGSTDASLPDLSAESMLTLTYVRINLAPANFRNLTTLGTTVKRKLAMKSAGVLNDFCGNTNNTIGTALPTGALRPFVVQQDRSTTTARLATDQETFTTTWDPTVTGKQLEIVGEVNTAIGGVTMYEASFRGVAAQMTLAQIKSLLTVAGWALQY